MTPQQAQAQALIREIDSVLNKASPRLPWVMTNEDAQQRQLLHQLRTYLASSMQPQPVAAPQRSLGTGEAAPLATIPSGQLDAMQQTLHAMMQEMHHLRTTVIQPLQADVAGLQQQREFLRQEVEQLERQRQAAIAAPPAPPQAALNPQVLHDVLQLLMQRLQESLSQQITQQIHQSFQHLQGTLQSTQDLPPAPATGMLAGATETHVQNLEALQARSDQILSTIDTTLRIVFESMQRNLESYQESLSRGLERMHGLGQQSEAQFAALLNHLAQRLGQEASTYLQASLQTQGLIAPERPLSQEPAFPASPATPPPESTARPSVQRSATDTLPFAGTELGTPAPGTVSAASRQLSPTGTPVAQRSETLHLEDLDLSDFNLDALDTSLIDAEGTDLEELLPTGEASAARFVDTEQGAETPREPLSPPSASSPPAPAPEAATETLDFLSQLAETFDAPPLASQDTPSAPPSTAASWDAGSTTAELRELYQSLFGSDEFAGATPTASPTARETAREAAALDTPPAASRDREAAPWEADRGADTEADTPPPTLANLFGEIDATIHPDSFELDTESFRDDASATAEDLADGLDTMADLGIDLADVPSSLEDFFFPDDTAASSPVADVDQATALPSEAELPGLEALTLDDLGLGEDRSEAAALSDRPGIPPATPTRDTSLPDLDADPFNLGALAAELGEPSALAGDLADLLAGLEPGEAPPAPLGGGVASGAGLEESFDAAAPDEDLLTDEALQPTASLETLQVDDNTLQQLSEDLFSLESGEFGAAVLPPLTPIMRTPEVPPAPDPLASWASPSEEPADSPVAGGMVGGDRDRTAPMAAPGGPDLSVEDLAADLFGALDDATAVNLDRGTDRPLASAPSRPVATGESGDIDLSLAVLEDLFTDRDPTGGADRPAPTRAPAPEAPPVSRPDAGILDDLFADVGDLDAGSKTAENSLASFQADFPLPDTDDPAKKKF